MRVSWSPEAMVIGLPSLDQAHREIVLLLSALTTAIEAAEPEAAGIAAAEFEERAGHHFAEEEQLFPFAPRHDVLHHRRAHRRAMKVIGLIKAAVDARDMAAATQVLDRLGPTILTAMLTDDSGLAAELHLG